MTKAARRALLTALLLVPSTRAVEAQVRPSASPSAAATDDERARSSYALGFAEATGLLREHKLERRIDPDSAAAGFKAALEGASPRYSRDEMTRALRPYQASGWIEPSNVASIQTQGRAFLVKNRSEPGVVQLPSGVQFRVIKPGKGPQPKRTDRVRLTYRRRLVDGTPYDSSPSSGEPVTIAIDQAARSWRQALPLVPGGSKLEIVAPAGFEFHDTSMLRPVPPSVVVISELDLVEDAPSSAPASPTPSTAAPPLSSPGK